MQKIGNLAYDLNGVLEEVEPNDLSQGDKEMQQWTQDEAIAYECACEAITHLQAILTSEIHDESKKLKPDTQRIKTLEDESIQLFRERKSLSVKDHAQIARIRYEYGTRIREWNDAHRAMAA